MDGKSKTIDQAINLSKYSKALIDNLQKIKKKPLPDEFSRISVSQTVSFLAILYEKLRNAVEYREEHLIRRAAIERIVKRRLSLNPQGQGEAENIIRELLWARYFPNESLSSYDVRQVQEIIDKYLYVRGLVINGRGDKIKFYLSQFLLDLLTSEIEEKLSPQKANQISLFSFFIYQVLRKKIKIKGVSQSQQDAYFYVAVEKAFAKSDLSYLRYHLFSLFYKPISKYKTANLKKISTNLVDNFKKIDQIINNPYSDKLIKFVKKQIPPFLILFEIIKKNINNSEKILSKKNRLWNQLEFVCRQKYDQTRDRLKQTAIRSLIYIFLTKMVFAIILEYPLSLFFFNEVNFFSIGINTLFPPILMLLIVGFVKIPGEDNTKRIYGRVIDIVNHDPSFEENVSLITKKPLVRRPVLIFGFTIFYALTFVITLSLIYAVLNLMKFNIISQAIFFFFVSVVTFFGYRVRQIAKEYRLEYKQSFFTPFIDFFFMPILSIGKFLSNEIAKLNFFIIIFDFLIEAPFKLIFEIVEEWISFVRARKEEII